MRCLPLIIVIWLSACARPSKGPVSEANGALSSDPETLGRALARRGRFMEASFYLEAAIAHGSEESEVLPLLITVQIHADRLRAAKQNALRLREIIGPSHALDSLLGLLARYTPAIKAGTEKEVEP